VVTVRKLSRTLPSAQILAFSTQMTLESVQRFPAADGASVSSAQSTIQPPGRFRPVPIARADASASVTIRFVRIPALSASALVSSAFVPRKVSRKSPNANSSATGALVPERFYRPQPNPRSTTQANSQMQGLPLLEFISFTAHFTSQALAPTTGGATVIFFEETFKWISTQEVLLTS
jgi:hypothetical protein